MLLEDGGPYTLLEDGRSHNKNGEMLKKERDHNEERIGGALMGAVVRSMLAGTGRTLYLCP